MTAGHYQYRGAPMGVPSREGEPDTDATFRLSRVPINNGGYDQSGAYWGLGAPLYHFEAQNGRISGHVRGRTREIAKAEVRKSYPNAKFYR